MSLIVYNKFEFNHFIIQIGTQIGLEGQCGGINYNGSTTCVTGLTCYVKNSRFSGCIQNCPKYWECQGNGYIIFKLKYYITNLNSIILLYK
jgi:hypothetical protein